MNESAFLFLVLAAIYFSECLLWVRRGAVAFVTPFGRRARLVHPSSWLGSHRGGIVFANPLPPLGFITVCETGADLDVEAIRARLEQFRGRSSALRILCNGLFAYLFVLCPVLIGMQGILFWWLPLLLGLAALTGATLLAYWRAHRALYPDDRDDRRRRLTAMLLSPPAAVRAHDALSRGLLSGYHPLAAAAALCPQPVFLDYARRVLIDARVPRPAATGGGAPAAAATTTGGDMERLAQEVDRLVALTGARPEDLNAPPAERDPQAHSYCPRCRSQYRVASGECSDCGGFRLQPLERGAPAAARAGE